MTEYEKDRFASLCLEDEESHPKDEICGINIYNEKRLHRILKRTLCEDEGCFERKVGRYVADILLGERIIEIQCASLYPLTDKIDYYLNGEGYEVTVVHSLSAEKRLIKADRESGEIKSVRRSPKKENIWSALPECYWLRELIPDRRLRVRLMLISADEFRYSERVRGRRTGAYDSEYFPRELLGDIVLCGSEDYRRFVPTELRAAEGFGMAEYSRLSGLKGKRLSMSLNLLCCLGILKKEKMGRKNIYYYQS